MWHEKSGSIPLWPSLLARGQIFLRHNSCGYKKVVPLVILGLPFAFVFLATGLQFSLLSDERLFHLPAIYRFASSLNSMASLLDAAKSYTAANGPLPYLILALWGKIVGFDISSLRFVSLLFSLGTVIVYYFVVKQIDAERSLLAAWLLLFYPYFFIYGFTLLVHSYALFFGMSGIYLFQRYIKTENVTCMVLSGLFLSLAVLCRQTYVVLATGVGLWGLLFYVTHRRSSYLLVVFCSTLSGFALIFLISMWNGLVPPKFQAAHYLYFTVEGLGLALISGSAFLFPAVYALRNQKTILIGGALVAAAVYALHVLTTSRALPLTRSLGIVPLTLAVLADKSWLLAFFVETVLMWAGASLLLRILSLSGDSIRNLVLILAVLSCGVALSMSYLFELYLIQAMPWWIILSVPLVSKKSSRLGWAIAYVCLTIGYFYVKLYLRLG